MTYRRIIVVLLSAALAWAGLTSAAAAAVVGTGDAIALNQREVRLSAIQASFARTEVRAAMVALGVDPAEAGQRVAALADRDLARLQAELDRLPAGGSLLGLIGAVFVVLLILELTGVIDIFKKV